MQRQGWGQLPDGSSLQATFSGSDQNFTVTGRATIDGQQVQTFSHAELTGGITLTLRQPHRYVIEVDVFFNGAASTTVTAAGGVQDSSGATLGSPLNLSSSGINGDHDTFELTALTQL